MGFLNSFIKFNDKKQINSFTLNGRDEKVDYDVRDEKPKPPPAGVYEDIEENMAYIRNRFSIPLNNDFVIRKIKMKNDRKAFLVFIDGMVDTEAVNLAIIKTLQEIPYFVDNEIYRYEEEIPDRFASHSQVMISDSMEDAAEEVNFGCCAVFVDKIPKVFIFDVKKWSSRGIEKPENEQSIYGPQEAFGEVIRTNTALIRKIIKTEKLIAESVKIGEVSKTRGLLLYINDIANPRLVEEARRRINGIDMDYVISIEEVEMMLEEDTFMVTTQFLGTERPDRVARALTEGRVALLLNGSPKALVFPTSIFELSSSVSDSYLRLPYANMSRVIRLFTTFASILLPGIYLATTLFHHEVIPTYLLYSIAAARENVPFPSIIELILMDISFEMIREAGIRMPGKIGSTLGIVGGLILGQAAVSAKIVSPIMIIIIAITGIGSFATADYSLSWSYRILRLAFIALGSMLGFYGIAIGIFIYSLYLASRKSFGTPFLAPLPEKGSRDMVNSIFVSPIWKKEKRPAFLDTVDKDNEPKISRKYR